MTVQKDSAIKKQDVNGNQKKVNSSTKNDANANKNEFNILLFSVDLRL